MSIESVLTNSATTAVEECTRVACWLSTQGGLVSFPLITIAGIIDGLNPCAIGMMVLLLGYLMVFSEVEGEAGQKEAIIRKKMLTLGVAYILSIFVTYLIVGFGLYQIVSQLQALPIRGWLYRVVGAGLLIAATIQWKDVFRPDLPFHLKIPDQTRSWLHPLIEKGSLPAVVLLGVMVTVLETPCSLPIYVGTATLLAQSGLPLAAIIGYFSYYNFLFVLPLIVVLFTALRLKRVVELREWEHTAKKWMHLGIAIVLTALGAYLIIQ